MISMMKLMKLPIRQLCVDASSRTILLKAMMVADMPTMGWKYTRKKTDSMLRKRIVTMNNGVSSYSFYLEGKKKTPFTSGSRIARPAPAAKESNSLAAYRKPMAVEKEDNFMGNLLSTMDALKPSFSGAAQTEIESCSQNIIIRRGIPHSMPLSISLMGRLATRACLTVTGPAG